MHALEKFENENPYAVFEWQTLATTLQAYVLEPHNKLSASAQTFCLIPFPTNETKAASPQYYHCINTQSFSLPTFTGNNFSSLQLETQSETDYIAAVNALKQHIQLGNIYEVNYCLELFCKKANISPLQVFLKLQQLANAPYARLVKLKEQYIISVSPELFLKRQGLHLISKPIKGTAARGATKAADEQNKNDLRHSVKEQTENVMIVDVARNDFSKLAQRGSVATDVLFGIETFNTVHQLVSTVSCRLQAHVTFEQIIEATYPIPSITGAPKQRATQLILETETFKRHYYCGTMGFIEPNGDFELAVIIRSIFYNTNTHFLNICVGSAITHLCDAKAEYEECLLKAKVLLKALNATILK